jgi:hypothetical protein
VKTDMSKHGAPGESPAFSLTNMIAATTRINAIVSASVTKSNRVAPRTSRLAAVPAGWC